jgi:hypothetical protein
MSNFGPEGLFAFTAVVHAATGVFAVLRMRTSHVPDYKEDFVGVPRTSPTLYALDPRSGEEEEEAPSENGETVGATDAPDEPAVAAPASEPEAKN